MLDLARFLYYETMTCPVFQRGSNHDSRRTRGNHGGGSSSNRSNSTLGMLFGSSVAVNAAGEEEEDVVEEELGGSARSDKFLILLQVDQLLCLEQYMHTISPQT